MFSLFSPRCGSLRTAPRTVYANNETQYHRLRGSDTQNIRLEGEHQGYPMNSDATSHQSPRHHMSRDDDTTSQSGTICARIHNKKHGLVVTKHNQSHTTTTTTHTRTQPTFCHA